MLGCLLDTIWETWGIGKHFHTQNFMQCLRWNYFASVVKPRNYWYYLLYETKLEQLNI